MWCINLQACLAGIAKLKASTSRKPIPPFFFGVHNFFQFIQWIFMSSLVCLYQYLAKIELIESPTAFGILNRPIEYSGIACAIVLINTSLLALEKSFSFQIRKSLERLRLSGMAKISFLVLGAKFHKPLIYSTAMCLHQ